MDLNYDLYEMFDDRVVLNHVIYMVRFIVPLNEIVYEAC